jgi:hypothetical protein
MYKNDFIVGLQQQYDTYKKNGNKKETIEIDYDSVEFLDADLRNINYRTCNNVKRVIAYKAVEVKTKKTIVFGKPFAKYSEGSRNVIKKLIDELLECGYRMNKAKAIACTILDLHNPNFNTLPLKQNTKII